MASFFGKTSNSEEKAKIGKFNLIKKSLNPTEDLNLRLKD